MKLKTKYEKVNWAITSVYTATRDSADDRICEILEVLAKGTKYEKDVREAIRHRDKLVEDTYRRKNGS